MREKTQPHFRRRSPPPHQPKYRDRTGSFSCPVRSDREEGQLRKLTEFNDTMARRETSASMKFQWDHLLAEKPATKQQKSTENERSTPYSTLLATSRNYGLSDNHDLWGPLQRNEELMARRGGSYTYTQQETQNSVYLEAQGSDDGYLPRKMVGVQDEYTRRNLGRKSIVDSIVDKVCDPDTTESRILGCDRSMQETASRHVMEQEGYSDYENIKWGGGGGGLGSRENVYEIQGTNQEEQMFQDSLQNMLKRKLMVDLKMNIGENPVSEEIHDPCYGDERYWSNEDMQQLPLLKSPRYEDSLIGRGEWEFDEMVSDGQGVADSDDWLPSPDLTASMQVQQHSSEPIKTSGRNIKERLGPASRNMKEHLGPASRDIKKRLGPAQKTSKTNPWVKNSLQNQSLRKNLNDIRECVNVQGGDSSKVKAKHAKTETRVRGSESLKVEAKRTNTDPPEDSEDFKRLVHISFLKFVKALNENSALRRKYTEQGGASTLKCSVCGSNSKEFMDTLSLAQHAFTSRTVGSRAEHLGFHKALCVLMEWSSVAALNSPWVRKILPDGEALALKEDLIIWPPVVVIHNSSIANYKPDERMIVSTEELSAILRGMGFGRGMAKVCHGRPANQSIMVVSFQGTLSGLEEAGRLHEFYAKNKYGRAEFKQIDFSSNNSSSGGIQIMPAEKVGNILYGYLGIADDLDKLDFGTKRRSVVKSKKEIQAIVDAPLNSK